MCSVSGVGLCEVVQLAEVLPALHPRAVVLPARHHLPLHPLLQVAAPRPRPLRVGVQSLTVPLTLHLNISELVFVTIKGVSKSFQNNPKKAPALGQFSILIDCAGIERMKAR